MKKTMVVTGAAGGIGTACAKMFKEHTLVLTDYSGALVEKTVATFREEGYTAVGQACDITKADQVRALRDFALAQGTFGGLVHTAGVSGSAKDVKKVYDIDLVGTDIVVHVFREAATEGSAVVLMASMMGHTVAADAKRDHALVHPREEGSFALVQRFVNGDADLMYNVAKRGVQLLCRAHAPSYGARGARILSVSPGVIMTPMAQKAAEEHPERMRQMREMTPMGRNGTPGDIAQVVQFLVGHGASFITGCDLLVDGGLVGQLTQGT
ncbi:SDR family oxidoreductase [Maribacter sp. 2307ULW6-5]|uniref:SDR family oxidoreductase n=1 Tax=Maribacter sp. 2307ULW6-5 TaxID=3386275 RepID=UPI0039BC4C0C